MHKLFSISALLVCVMVIGMFGCGSDDEEPKKPTTPEVTKPPEAFFNSWEVVSINDEDPLIFVNADEPDEEDRPKINTENFTYQFAEDGSWTLKVDFEMGEFPEDPENVGKVVLNGEWSGTHTYNNSVLSLAKAETNVEITSVPEDFFENLFEVNVTEAKNEILEKFNTHVFNPFAKTRISIVEETLTLETTGSTKNTMVLEKQ